MQRKTFRIMIFFLFLLPFLSSCNDTDNSRGAKLILNGNDKGTRVEWRQKDSGILIDIDQFMNGIGGRFVPINMNKGIVAQYGKRIGFATNGAPLGMVQVKLCQMNPASKQEDGRLWAPVGFLEQVINGKITVNVDGNLLEVRAQAPLKPGDVIPEAASLSSALKSKNYIVQQGDICLSNAIDVCYAGYSPNANGNNAGFPYFCIQAPLPPDAQHAVVPTQFTYTMREDEGFIIIGRTPPDCDYFSYRSYFMSRCVSTTNPFDRKKIYTQLGDPINSYNIMEDMFYPRAGGRKVNKFDSFFILVSTPDRKLYDDVIAAAEEAGLDKDKILLDVVDRNLVRLGNDDFADLMNFLHRFSNPKDKNAGEAYLNRPSLEILRITPSTQRRADFIQPFNPRQRGAGTNENSMTPAVSQLRQAIIDKYSRDYNISELTTHIWLGKTGAEAINDLEDVLGETRDTLYLNSDTFRFDPKTLVIVYGVNHTSIPKSVYGNVSCYGAKYANGFGGITNKMYNENVTRSFPELADVPNIKNLYLWKFARTKLDEDTYAVPTDVNSDLNGINNGDEAFMGFRSYIDPNSHDLLGPDPNEIIFDKVMVLTPK